MRAAFLLAFSIGCAVVASCGGDSNISTDLTTLCDTDADCVDARDDARHCGTAEAVNLCCRIGTQKCACGDDNSCEDTLTCYEQTMPDYPEGRFCGLSNLGFIPGLEPVE